MSRRVHMREAGHVQVCTHERGGHIQECTLLSAVPSKPLLSYCSCIDVLLGSGVILPVCCESQEWWWKRNRVCP